MSLTYELNQWKYEKKCLSTVEKLKENGFTAFYFPEKSHAVSYILENAKDACSIGVGGSMTIADLGVVNLLTDMGKTLFNHNQPGLTPEQKLDIMKNAMLSDVYLCSANAITTDGFIVNIDATGNRVAAMIFGPKKVILVVGRNKIVEGNIDEAVKRIKNWASPPNARRLNFKTPCKDTGFCSDCKSPDRICRVISIMERKPRLTDFHVLIVNEELGF